MVREVKEKLERRIFKNCVSFGFLIFLNEIIIRICTNNIILDWNTLRILISSIIYGIIITLISLIFKKDNKIYKTIVASFLAIYSWIEINLYEYLGFFMGIGNAEQGTKVIDYIKEYIAAAKWQSYSLFVILIIYLIYIWIIEKIIKQKKLNKTTYFKFTITNPKRNIKIIIYTMIILILLITTYYYTLKSKHMQNELQYTDNITLIINGDNPNLYVSRFGLYTYGINDIITNIFNINIENNNENNEDNIENIITDREIDDTAWNNLIEQETDKTLNKLNNYFINRTITSTNDKTGIYEGKNLIVILLESTNYIAINEERYPTIYKLWSEGTSFRNNYSPRNNCATGNNEMTVMNGLYSINQTCTVNKYKNNIYPESLFNMFNDLGYITTSYHDYADHYYSRKTIHKNMGSSQYYNASDLGINYSSEYKEWPSDIELIEKSVPKFINEDHFMVFLSTVTTHQPYGVDSEYGNKNLDLLEDLDYDISVKRYMSKMYELDKALELLLEELEKAGKLEDTVIVLFGDHYPYGLNKDDISEVLGYNVNVNNEMDRTPMIIYNAGQEPEIVEDYTSLIDLLPTLLNMFGIDYDPRLYLGNDIFSSEDHRAYFADGSWQDEIGYYNASKGTFTPINPEITYTAEEINQINKEINTKQSMSALAIKNDYFNYLFKEIEKYKTNESEE